MNKNLRIVTTCTFALMCTTNPLVKSGNLTIELTEKAGRSGVPAKLFNFEIFNESRRKIYVSLENATNTVDPFPIEPGQYMRVGPLNYALADTIIHIEDEAGAPLRFKIKKNKVRTIALKYGRGNTRTVEPQSGKKSKSGFILEKNVTKDILEES